MSTVLRIKNDKIFKFFVEIESDGMLKCVNKEFKKLNETENGILKLLRKGLQISVKEGEFEDKEDGKMKIEEIEEINDYIFKIQPLFIYEEYDFYKKDEIKENDKKEENDNDKKEKKKVFQTKNKKFDYGKMMKGIGENKKNN
ncbi:hypothetical protein ACQ4LE_010939 [Meloidogyne hapla]